MVISSLQSKEEKDELLTKIKNGDLHIIVGTHALLTERMVYSNLGLLVVDEEQVPQSFQSLKFSVFFCCHLCDCCSSLVVLCIAFDYDDLGEGQVPREE